METKFTSGPWRVDTESRAKFDSNTGERLTEVQNFWVRDPRDVSVALFTNECDRILGDRNSEANAHLIAAAPELYEALQDAVSAWGDYAPSSPNSKAYKAMIKARAALKKARGENMKEFTDERQNQDETV